ncbi:MAG: DUF4347 domain-containing protein, partial [Planctomycetaceae bacterium]
MARHRDFFDPSRRRLQMEPLEDRVLFDAAPDAALAAGAEGAGEDLNVPAQVQQAESQAQQQQENQQQVASELVLINSNVPDPQSLLLSLMAQNPGRSFELEVLDASMDGVEQITNLLQSRQGEYSAIHIVSHGEAGTVQLGNTWLTQQNITAYAGQIAQWGNAFTTEGDLLFYGCNLAASSDGRQLLTDIATLTGADVAASDDITGHADLGGDWELEYRHGEVEAVGLSSPQWHGVLAPFNISATTLPTVSGGNNVGAKAVWVNAGTVGGVPIDLVATVISASPTADVQFTTGGDDPYVMIQEFGATGIRIEALIEWRAYQSGTGQTVAAAGDVNFYISDIDGISGPNTIESVRADLDGLYSFTRNNPTSLSITTNGTYVEATGNAPYAGVSPEPSIRFSWKNVSSWRVTYIVENTIYGQRFYQHDGDGDLTFTTPVTIGLPQLDLDGNDSSGATNGNYITNYTENGTAVSIADVDAIVDDANGTLAGATIVLTKQEANDLLSVGSLPAGITSSINTAVPGFVTVTLSGTASLASYQAAIQAVTFSNSGDNPGTNDRTVTVQLTDGAFVSKTRTATIHVAVSNDPPAVDLNGAGVGTGYTSTFTEDGASVAIMDATGTVTDVDSANIASATITLTNAQASDVLSISGALPAGISSVIDTSVPGVITVTLTGSATKANYETALKAIRFANSSQDPNTTNRNITVKVNDGSLDSNVATATIQVVAVNDPPVLNLDVNNSTGGADDGNYQTTYTENGAAVTVADVDATAVDAESKLASLSFQVSGQVDGATEVISIEGATFPLDANANLTTATVAGVPFDLTIDYVAGTGTFNITRTGGGIITPAQMTLILKAITYQHTSENPTAGDRVLSFTLTDDIGATGTATSTVTVVPVNDPPVAVDDSFQEDEDTVITGNVITEDNGSGIDSDPESDPLVLTQFQVDGDLTVYSAGETATIAGVGALVMNADGSFVFTPEANYNGTVPKVTYTIAEAVNIVVNGDLEGTAPGVNRNTHNATLPPNWNVSGTPDVFNAATNFNGYTWAPNPDGGDFLHAIGISVNREGFTQTLTGLTVGQQYVVQFAQSIASSNWGGSGDGHWQVTFGTETHNAEIMTTPALGATYPWEVQELVFTATSATQAITFRAFEDGAGNRVDLGIDSIALLIPNPTPLTDTACLEIVVDPVNDDFTDANETPSVAEDGLLMGNLLTGTSSVDGPVTVTQFVVNATTYLVTPTTPGTVNLTEGTLTIDSVGNYTFVPASNYFGNVPQVTYTMTDGSGTDDTSTLDITVTPVNDAPVASNDGPITVLGGTTSTVDVIGNDTDIDGDSLAVSEIIDPNGGSPIVYVIGNGVGETPIGSPIML